MTEMTGPQERASRAAAELAHAVTGLCAEQYSDRTNGDYAVIIRAVNDSDGLTFTWDWFVKPLGGHPAT